MLRPLARGCAEQPEARAQAGEHDGNHIGGCPGDAMSSGLLTPRLLRRDTRCIACFADAHTMRKLFAGEENLDERENTCQRQTVSVYLTLYED